MEEVKPDLGTFLRARLDEDEQSARHRWNRDGATSEKFHGTPYDPTRVLRDIESKRRILDETVEILDQMEDRINGEWGSSRDPLEESDNLLRLLALPYSDHLSYRQEWRP